VAPVQLAQPFDRRQLFRRAGALAAAAGPAILLGACGRAEQPPPAGVPTTIGGPPNWNALAASLVGSVVVPGDAAYPDAKLLFDTRFDGLNPAAIAFCRSPSDVQRSVDFARRHGVQLTARSGGHSYAGYSSCPGLIIDVTGLSDVTVAGNARAVIGPGARLVDIYGTLGSEGVLLPGGSCPTVGIAGLTLGGGIGVLGRRYGLTCDNLTSLDVVTADGRLATCDAGHNADLFWASRGGGGGNFGIVTSFTFSVHPIPDIALFTLDFPWASAGDVLGGWLTWLPTTSDDLWANCQLDSSGGAGGGPSVRVTGVYAGSVADCTAALAPLRTASGVAPTSQFVGPETYERAMMVEAGCEDLSVAQCHLPSQNPAGVLDRSTFAAASAYLADPFPTAALDAATEAVASANPTPFGAAMIFDGYGGAIARVPSSATAFVHRDAIAGIQYFTSWGESAPGSVAAAATAWLAGTAATLAPYTTGAYVNYIDPAQPDYLTAYYGTNLARLVDVKRAVDPDDVFHFAQSIPTVLPG
jgi:FAD/FMN-containing dehydrogenase